MRTWLSAVSVAVLAAAAAPVCAQQTDQGPASPNVASPNATNKTDAPTQVTVTARLGDPKNSTASKTIVGHDDLSKYGDTSLGDALKRIPGVSVGSDGGIGLRGLGSGYTQVLINGEKAPPDFSIASLSPDSIERIEITHTPTADMRGDAIAGTINIILRKSVRSHETEAKFGVGRGRGGPELSASGSLSDRKDHLSYVVGVSVNHSDSVNSDVQIASTLDGTGQRVALNDTYELFRFGDDKLSLTPNLTLTGDHGENTSLQGLVNLHRQDIFRGQTTDAPLGTPLPYADNPQNIVYDSHLARLDLDHSRSLTSAIALKLKVSVSDFHRGGFVHQTGHDADGNLILDDIITSTADQQSLATNGSLSFQVFHGHKLDLGWDGSDDWRNERRTEVNQPLPGALAGDSDHLFFSQIRRAAVFIQDDWRIGDTWSAYLGLRDEEMDTFSHGTTYGGIHNRLSAASPVIQALWKPDGTGRDQIRFAFGRTFKAPDIASLVPRPYVSLNNTVFAPEGLGNPGLKPELAWGTDVSYEHDWKGGAMVSLSAFHRDITGVVLTQTLLQNGLWVSTPVNSGKAEASGVTLEGRTTWLGTDIHASLTRNASRIDAFPGPGNVLADQPPVQANFDIDRKIGKLWTLGGSYAFSQGLVAEQSLAEWTKIPDTHEIDLYALRKVSAHLNLRFSVDDLLHRAYRQSSVYEDDPGRQINYSLNPAVSTVRLNLEFKG